jgi:hypothetical protein
MDTDRGLRSSFGGLISWELEILLQTEVVLYAKFVLDQGSGNASTGRVQKQQTERSTAFGRSEICPW